MPQELSYFQEHPTRPNGDPWPLYIRWMEGLFDAPKEFFVDPTAKEPCRPATIQSALLTLREFMNHDGSGAFPSHDTIARAGSMSPRTCMRALLQAENIGWIKVRRRPRRSNVYRATFPKGYVDKLDPEAVLKHLRTMPYRDYLQTAHWKYTRDTVLHRAQFRCEKCDAPGKLNVHHLTYARRGREEWDDLIALCEPCHREAHGIQQPVDKPVDEMEPEMAS